MIIARRIHELSGILELDISAQPPYQHALRELKTPSLSLQCIALVGLIAAEATAPDLVPGTPLRFYPACLIGILAGLLISYASRNLRALNVGGCLTIASVCVGFRLILAAYDRSDYWALPLSGLIATSVAVIVSGPLMYGFMMVLAWLLLDLDLSGPDGWWSTLYMASAVVIGLMLSIFLFRLRVFNHLCTLRLVQMAYKDHLTGIPNRRWFMEAVNLGLKNQQLNGYLLMIDVDDFKKINDQAGHDVGDAVLQKIAAIIADTAIGLPHCRLGGEEFAVVVRGGLAQASQVGQSLLRAVSGATVAERRMSISIGGCLLRSDSLSDTMRRADEALYQAKQAGKNRVVFSDACAVDIHSNLF
ncbi:GGDEF domain-containing protein [Duganella levis]|uniref:diguanylate cyclase n=1 Tax=Duganella levis TaxID=2692169 RepID=A0ABW9VTA2_9BURK|nr:GGDEF domain-containing protein [Duganella levis]MYN24853.1 diguanylate cyclase [Duganella levis]